MVLVQFWVGMFLGSYRALVMLLSQCTNLLSFTSYHLPFSFFYVLLLLFYLFCLNYGHWKL